MGETGPSDEFIFARDLAWLNDADVVVAEVTTPSLGVGYELGYTSGKKPILALYRPRENARVSAMISGCPEIRISQYSKLDDVDSLLADFFKQIEQTFSLTTKCDNK